MSRVPRWARHAWGGVGLGVLVVAMAASLGAIPGAHAAAAVHVRCGETIARDTTLANDLTDCSGNGLVIGADNITLDLNGHTIDGTRQHGDAAGIDNVAGYDGVTIEHGSVRAFVEGVLIVGATKNRVRDLVTTHQAHGGITVAESTGIRIERNTSVDNISGIIMSASREVQVERNSISDIEFGGIPVFRSEDVRVADNSVARTGDAGILLVDESNRNRVEHNSVSDCGEGIVVAEGSDSNGVTGNAVARSDEGVILDAGTSHNMVTKNALRNNGFGGVAVVGSDENLISHNMLVGNGDGDASDGGIHVLSLPDDATIASDHNVLLKNTLIATSGDGIRVDAGQSHSVVKDNRSNQSTDDGIDIDSPATILTANRTNRNQDLGIEAVPGVSDGGRNAASGNRNPLQCTNVVCK